MLPAFLFIEMVSKVKLIPEQVADLVEVVLEDMGIQLIDVEYLSIRGRWVLRLYIDKEGGVTIDDCARVSREIGDVIDVKDIISHEYVLEVSSPGLDRPLRKEKHIRDVIGMKIKVKMAVPVNERRNFTGLLKNFHEGDLILEIERGEVSLPWRDVESANLVYEFDA